MLKNFIAMLKKEIGKTRGGGTVNELHFDDGNGGTEVMYNVVTKTVTKDGPQTNISACTYQKPEIVDD